MGSGPGTSAARASALGWGQRLGIWAWSFVGVVSALTIALAAVAGFATVQGVIQQTSEIAESVDAAVETAAADLDADEESLQNAREAIEGAAPTIGDGFLTELAEPAWVVATSAVARLRDQGFFDRVAVQAEPTVRCMLE